MVQISRPVEAASKMHELPTHSDGQEETKRMGRLGMDAQRLRCWNTPSGVSARARASLRELCERMSHTLLPQSAIRPWCFSPPQIASLVQYW
jgi:hypothetical protein